MAQSAVIASTKASCTQIDPKDDGTAIVLSDRQSKEGAGSVEFAAGKVIGISRRWGRR